MQGDKIKMIRIAKNLSRYRLARLAGVSDLTVKAIEEGRGVQFKVFEKIVDALDHQIIIKPKSNARPNDTQY